MTDVALLNHGGGMITALSPAGMEVAQQNLIALCDQKVEAEKLEIADLERTIAEAQKVGLNDAAWKRRLGKARAKMMFYRKVKGALLQGFYIVPPFPVQHFAIRTKRDWPKRRHTPTTSHWSSDFVQEAQRLDVGEGEYRNPFPVKESHSVSVQKPDGKVVAEVRWNAGEWDHLEFPFKLVKPEVIAAVGKALTAKIFDALGVLPNYKTPDPLVIGQIFPPHRPHDPVCFFVAWWMDPKDL